MDDPCVSPTRPAASSRQPPPVPAVSARAGGPLQAAVAEHLLQLGRLLREVDAETGALAERLAGAVAVSTAALSAAGPGAAAVPLAGGDFGRRQGVRRCPESLQGPHVSPVPSSASSSHGAGLLPRYLLPRTRSNTSLPDAAQHNSGDSTVSSQSVQAPVGVGFRTASLEGFHGSVLSVPSGDYSASQSITEDANTADIVDVLARGGPRTVSSERLGRWTLGGSRTFQVLQSPWLEAFWACLIVLNTIVMITQEEYMGAKAGHGLGYYTRYGSPEYNRAYWPGAESAFLVLESTFAVLFTVEVFLSMLSKGLRFCKDPWELLDFTVVVCSDLSVLFVLLSADDSLSEGPVNVSMFRLLRLAKLVRLVKLLRKIEGFDALHLMSTALKSSLAALGWSFVLIVLLQTFFALVMTSVIRVYSLNDSNAELSQEVKLTAFLYFGTFVRSFFTLFEVALANYPTVARFMVEEIGEGWLIPIVLYKFAIGVAVMGVLNGVFIQETFKVASNDDTIMVRTKRKAANLHRDKMTRLFKYADRQGVGKIGLREFRHVLKHPSIQMWLASMDLDCTDADQLFALIATGEFITVEELIDGIFRLKGSARSIDLKVLLQRLGTPLCTDALKASPDDLQTPTCRGLKENQRGRRLSAATPTSSLEPE